VPAVLERLGVVGGPRSELGRRCATQPRRT
jgi:hypothetical protein